MLKPPPQVAIIGAGPAGLMAAETAAHHGLHVVVYDAMPSAGRKFLMAGKSGLNLTHAEPYDRFVTRYAVQQANIEPLLQQFGAEALRHWAEQLGIATFVGSSSRVFTQDFKAAPLLRAWLHRLREQGVKFQMRHRWCGWRDDGCLQFATPTGDQFISSDATVLALGGGSWPQLGSTGDWITPLTARDIPITPLRPANCGFDIGWSDHFRQRFAGVPLKSVLLTYSPAHGSTRQQRGDLMITPTGIEGGTVYALSAPLRDEIERTGHAELCVDLMPDRSLAQLTQALTRPRGSHSLAKHLQRSALTGIKAALLRELLSPEQLHDMHSLATAIKALPLPLTAPRPLQEAISTAGGLCFSALDERLMVRQYPGLFCAGEMLDWEAPTGGYLLTACFASGYVAGQGVAAFVAQHSPRLL